MQISLTTLTQRVKNKIRLQYKDKTTLASAMAISAVTDETAYVFLGQGDRVAEGDMIEIDNELMLVEESPYQSTTLISNLDNSSTSFNVTSNASVNSGSQLKIDSEIIKVASVSGSTFVSAQRGILGTTPSTHGNNSLIYDYNMIRVSRGYQGTTAAVHSLGASVNFVDIFSSTEVQRQVQNAVNYMWPYLYQDYRSDLYRFGPTSSDNYLGDDNSNAGVAQWTASLDAITPTLNTTDFKDQSGSMNLGINVAASTATYAEYQASFPSAITVASADYMNFWFYINDLTDTSKNDYYSRNLLEVRVGNHSAAYYDFFIPKDEFVTGWNYISIPFRNYDTSGTIDDTTIDYADLRVYTNPYNPQNIPIGNIKIDGIMFSQNAFTTTRGKIELPQYVNYVGTVRPFATNFSSYSERADWRIIEKKPDIFEVVLNHFPVAGKPIEITGAKQYQFDSNSNLNIPIYLEELIVLYAYKGLIESRMFELMRFDRYSSKINRENAVLQDYLRSQNQIESRIGELFTRYGKSLDAQKLDFGQNWSNGGPVPGTGNIFSIGSPFY